MFLDRFSSIERTSAALNLLLVPTVRERRHDSLVQARALLFPYCIPQEYLPLREIRWDDFL